MVAPLDFFPIDVKDDTLDWDGSRQRYKGIVSTFALGCGNLESDLLWGREVDELERLGPANDISACQV